ncbi:MAG: NUDIX hydrolase [Anaerolineales bacterium]
MSQSFRSAVHLFFIENDQILLSKRANTGYMDGYYSVVAGHIEPGETVVQAAVREAAEEAGVLILPHDTEVVGVMHRRDGEERIDFFARVHRWVGEPYNAEPEKCSDLSWFPLDALPEDIVPYVYKALENYSANQWFDTFGF